MTSPHSSPIKVLHVLNILNQGGVETWLMHVLRHIDRDKFQIDFMVHSPNEGVYDAEVRRLGSQIRYCEGYKNPLAYAANFKALLREAGPYDVVHSHVHHYSGIVLDIANRLGIHGRIAHSHNDTSHVDDGAGWFRQAYLRWSLSQIQRHSTLRLAASRQAADSLFGEDWPGDRATRLLYYGIDLAPFAQPADASPLRARLGIPTNAFVIGHVGRFAPQKNHEFLLSIFDEMAHRRPDTILLLVGDGAGRPSLEALAEAKGLRERVIFAGTRPDIPLLMRDVMDVFVFPSLYEGLGLVLLEAQAAGLPCVISDVVPQEADVAPDFVTRLSLQRSPSDWADAIENRLEGPPLSRPLGFAHVADSPFTIQSSVRQLEDIYLELASVRSAS